MENCGKDTCINKNCDLCYEIALDNWFKENRIAASL